MQKKILNFNPKIGLTEPVVDGLRSDCCGAITDAIFLQTLFLELFKQNEGWEEKADKLTSFCKKGNEEKWNIGEKLIYFSNLQQKCNINLYADTDVDVQTLMKAEELGKIVEEAIIDWIVQRSC